MYFDWFKFTIHAFTNQRIENTSANVYIMQVYYLVFLVNNFVMNWTYFSLGVLHIIYCNNYTLIEII